MSNEFGISLWLRRLIGTVIPKMGFWRIHFMSNTLRLVMVPKFGFRLAMDTILEMNGQRNETDVNNPIDTAQTRMLKWACLPFLNPSPGAPLGSWTNRDSLTDCAVPQ
jgi:hypothetical protein